jgi:hypothetical protein
VLHIRNSETQNLTAEVLDMQGRVVYDLSLTFGENQLNVSELNSGIYFLKLSNQTKQLQVKRIVVE